MSIYGERHKIFHDHHVETKAKLDSLLAKNSEIEVNNDQVEAKLDTGNASLASVDGKITACNTGAVVVSSSALPSGASSEAKQDANNASNASIDSKIVSCNTGAVVVSSSALPSGASSEAKQDANNASNASIDSKIVACNTGAVVVSSSALASGASSEAKQDVIIGHLDGVEGLITATNSALAGTLSVSAPTVTKSASTPISNQAINGQSVHLTSEIDIQNARHLTIFGSSSNVSDSHEFDLFVSNASGGTYYKTSHSGFYISGNVHLLVNDIPYRYIKLQIKNGNSSTGVSDNFTLHLVHSD